MDECSSQDDFEAEFHKLLATGDEEETTTSTTVSTVIFPIESSFNLQELSIPTPQTPKPKKRKDSKASSSTSFVIQQDQINSYSSSSPTIVEFKEDPLSSYLNKSSGGSFARTQPERKKRGRPPTLRFKNIEYNSESKQREAGTNSILSATPKNYNGIQLRDRRSEDDFYSPIWIRGRGADREGLCPICSPPIWFKIKQSAYWYHMNFFHGISAATGRPYKRPLSYRLSETVVGVKRVEGHCGHCLLWVVIAADYQNREIDKDSLNLTSWYKHAQKCHYRTREFHIPEEFNDT